MTRTLAIIGGSGLYDLPGLTDIQEHTLETPFGTLDDPIVEGYLEGVRLLFVARHGRGHRLLPSEVNYRANIFALKMLGASQIISISAVGSMKEEIRPGDLVVVDQFIDRTKGRPSTFFGEGCVAHVMFADPVCAELAELLYRAAASLDVTIHRGGTLMVMEGPAFSTRAESHMHRQMGVDLIGMTAMPEAKLAREAEICYATLALATDYDCWHENEDDVTVEAVIRILKQNAHNAKEVIRRMATVERPVCGVGCSEALEHAIITERDAIPASAIQRLQPILERVLS